MLKAGSEQKAFDGSIGFYAHTSAKTKTEIRFAVFVPPQARAHNVPGFRIQAEIRWDKIFASVASKVRGRQRVTLIVMTSPLDQYWFISNRQIRYKPMKLIAKQRLEHDWRKAIML